MGVFEMTNHTTKPTFEPVLSNGFTSPYNTYIWQMCKFNDRLYIGTFQNSFVGLRFGMFSLYSSADGRNWDIETDNAFGPSNSKLIHRLLFPKVGDYGIRTLRVHNDKLYIRTATAHNSCKVYACEAK